MAENKTDRRVRRTKRLLLESLTSLMKEKPIKDISVKELTDLADINRGTFYLHYRDIYDMLEQLEDEWFADFNELLDKTPPAPDSTGSVARLSENMFQFLLDNKDIADALLGPNGGSDIHQPTEGSAAHANILPVEAPLPQYPLF